MSFITESQLAAYRTQTKTFSAESLESSFGNNQRYFYLINMMSEKYYKMMFLC